MVLKATVLKCTQMTNVVFLVEASKMILRM